MIKYIFLFALLTSCNKELKEDNNTNTVEATLIYSDVAIDGCGWLILIDSNKVYHPDFLPDSFKKNNLAVLINYKEINDSFHCGIANSAIPSVHIKSIVLR